MHAAHAAGRSYLHPFGSEEVEVEVCSKDGLGTLLVVCAPLEESCCMQAVCRKLFGDVHELAGLGIEAYK